MTRKENTRSAAEAVLKAFGQVDVLINNAGVTQPLKIMDIEASH